MYRWDEYFYKVSNTVADNSKCLSRKIGAVIVKDKSIISTGYNGPPRGVPSCEWRYVMDPAIFNKTTEQQKKDGKENIVCPRKMLGYKSGEAVGLCVAGHAERNAIVNAARHGICVKGSTMYLNVPVPCKECLIEIINAGINEVVVTNHSYYDEATGYLLRSSKLVIREYERGIVK
jgi:dCMP deaminase